MADNEIRLNVTAVESEPLNVCVEQVPMNPVNVENTYKGIDYDLLKNKPSIDGVTLEGDKTTAEVIGFDKEYVDEAILTTNAKIDNVEQDLSDRIDNISVSTDVYTKEEIDNKVIVIEADIDAQADAIQKTRSDFMESDSELQQQINAHAEELTTQKNDIDELGDQVAGIESKIPEGTSDTNPLINKQQLLDEEMDIRSDFNESVSELQTQITAQASAIANKVDATGDTMTGALNLPELNVATSEGTLNLSITAGVATIATNNGLDIVSQTKFDTAPTTDDSTTWADALDTSLVRKAQVATAIAEAGGGGSVPDNVYTQDNLVAGKNIEIEEPAKEIISYSYVPYTLGFGDGPFPELLYSSNKSNPYGTLTYYYLDPELKQYYGYSQTYEASGVLVVTDHSAPPKYLCGVASQVGIPVEVSSGPRKINCVGAYTQTNLLGGKDIEIVPEPVEGGIDEHTLACWHFDGNQIDEVSEQSFSGGNYTYQIGKFGNSLYKGSSDNFVTSRKLLSSLNTNTMEEFTIDFWFSFDSSSSYAIVCTGNNPTNSVNIYYAKISPFSILLSDSYDGGIYYDIKEKYTFPATLTYGRYYHVALQVNNFVAKVFFEGEEVLSADFTSAGLSTSITGFKVNGFASKIDELRISDCVRYTEDFEPPTKPYQLAEPTGNMVVNYTGEEVDLSGKADTDLGNTSPSTSFKETAIGWSMPDYSTFTTIAASTNFEAPTSGYVSYVAGTNTDTSNLINSASQGYISINGAVVLNATYTHGSDGAHPDSGFYPVGKGKPVYHTMTSGTVYFYPVEGA